MGDSCSSENAMESPAFYAHVKNLPTPYIVFIPLVAVCLLCSLLILVPNVRKVYILGSRARREAKGVRLPLLYWATITLQTLPIVLLLLKLVEVLFPRQEKLAHLLSACWEAYAFYSFLELIILYMDGPENTLKLLENGPPVKIWAVPPLGCCFSSCCPEARLDQKQIKRVMMLVFQYVVLYPLISLIDALDTTSIRYLGVIKIVSLVICIYGLFALLHSTKHVISCLRTHRKFWAVKGILVINTVTLSVFQFVEDSYNVNWMMNNSSYDVPAPGAWAAAAIAVACVPYSFLSKYAYHVSEFDLIPITGNENGKESNAEQHKKSEVLSVEINTL